MSGGIPAYLSFAAQRENYRDFPAVARLGQQLGVTRVWADRMVADAAGVAADVVVEGWKRLSGIFGLPHISPLSKHRRITGVEMIRGISKKIAN